MRKPKAYPWEVWVRGKRDGADWMFSRYRFRWAAAIARVLAGPGTYVKEAAWYGHQG